MKIRLKLTTPGGNSILIDRTGPVLRIGRDPACEVVLEGEDAGKAASRFHALINLASSGPQLVDTDSANKTFCNDHLIASPVSLSVGDRIRIGFTGSTLTVLDIDTGTTSPLRLWRKQHAKVVVAGGSAVCALIFLLACLLWPGPRTNRQDGSSRATSGRPEQSSVPNPKTNPGLMPTTKARSGKMTEAVPIAANPEMQEIGHYLRPISGRASVLLQRAGDGYPWTVLRSGQPVTSSCALVSLPGYESLVSLKSGMQLKLWGSLPELGGSVLECVVMLGVPEPTSSLDVVLERGRIELAATGKIPSLVRLRFLREVWDILLLEPQSKICVELAPQLEGQQLALFSHGKIRLRTQKQTLSCNTPSRIGWSTAHPDRLTEENLPSMPLWWGNPPPATDTAKDAVLSLNDWALKRLDRSTDVIDTILTGSRESPDRTDRLLGLWFLGALDQASRLMEFLEDNDPTHADVRTTAVYALRDWLGRNEKRQETLIRWIQQQRGFSRENASLVVTLLAPFSTKVLEDPATYRTLVSHLNHEKLAVRHLASLHLYVELASRVPLQALEIDYSPVWVTDKREKAVGRWLKVLAANPRPK